MDPKSLADWLRRPVVDASARRAIQVAEGWLWGALPRSTTNWPSPMPPDLEAAAFELAAIAYDNPEGLASSTVGEDARVWVMATKREILERVAKRYQGTAAPQHFFPPPPAPVLS